jgi:myo-inositol-1(or 4)-monophosphatase
MHDFMDVCEQAARAGGRVLLDMQGRIDAHEKAPKDLVTQADLLSQQVIRDTLLCAFPSHAFLGEEEAGLQLPSHGGPAEFCWIVDPLDGTTNYVHQLPAYSVSVALRRRQSIVVGTVFDPLRDECFTAELGGGAHRNASRIHSSECSQMDQALVAASFGVNVPRGSAEVARFVEVLHRCQAIRRLGSTALNLCYVASGRFDAYWGTSARIWDVAAGQLIACEAGATLTAVDGTPFELDRPQFAVSATPQLHEQLIDILGRAKP